MSPDWSSKPDAAPYADLANPQGLNLYSYVFNNPLFLTDPSGHACDDSVSALESDTTSTDKGGGMIETVRVGGRCDPFADLATIAMSPAQEVTPQQTQSIPLAPISPAPTPNRTIQILQCASKTANQFSIAGVLGVNEETHPVGAAIGNAFLGNTFSGISDTNHPYRHRSIWSGLRGLFSGRDGSGSTHWNGSCF